MKINEIMVSGDLGEGIWYRFAGDCSLSRKSAIIFNCRIKYDGNPTNWHLINGQGWDQMRDEMNDCLRNLISEIIPEHVRHRAPSDENNLNAIAVFSPTILTDNPHCSS